MVKKEFIARLQEEMIKGSFRPIAKDTSLLGVYAECGKETIPRLMEVTMEVRAARFPHA